MSIRPSTLKPGDRLTFNGRHILTFTHRERVPGRESRCWFTCPDYVGLDGPKDNGACTAGYARIIRHAARVA